MKKIIPIAFGLALIGLSACEQQTEQAQVQPDQMISAERIRADIEFLADDVMRGRDTGSVEYDIAANFFANRLQYLGLDPMPGYDGYAQKFAFKTATAQDADLTIMSTDENKVFGYKEDFTTSANFISETAGVENAGIVFAGYGIHAPSLGHDDYQGIDATGKFVVVFDGTPSNFATNERAHYSRRGKLDSLNEMGAVGVIYLQDKQDLERNSFEQSKGRPARQSLRWATADGVVRGQNDSLQYSISLSADAADFLFQGEQISYEDLVTAFAEGQSQSFELGKTLNFSVTSEHGSIASQNVAGVLEGTDPTMKNEYVIYSAHLDHVGERCRRINGDEEDHICNGAYDNASGISSILEVARVMAALPAEQAPKRSVVFVAVSGEERGLLGSDYFAQNTPAIINNGIANINLDMPLFLSASTGVTAIGAPHSTIGDESAKAAKAVGLVPVDDPFPEQTLFVRSDHYNFVKQGIPAALIFTSFSPNDENPDPRGLYWPFLSEQYHSNKDDLDLPFVMDTARDYGRYALVMGLNIANQQGVPQWKEGDFFGDMYKRR